MSRMVLVLAAVSLAVTTAAADRKVEEAVAKAEGHIAKGRLDEALKTMQKVADQQPSNPEAHIALARIQMRAGSLPGAFEEAAATAAKAVEVSASSAPEMKAQALAFRAEMDLLRGSAKDAVKHAEEAVALAANPESLAVLARAQARAQRADAVATGQKAVAAGPQSASAHEGLGYALLAAERAAEAEASFRKAVELEPRRAPARTGLASALLDQGKAAEAVVEARKATEDEPRWAEGFTVLGTAILAEKKDAWTEAIGQAQQGNFLNPRNPVVQVALGRLFEAGGNLDQAASAYQRALEADPEFVPARLALLQIQSRRGDLAAAEKEALAIVETTPQSGPAQLALGRIRARKGEWLEAIEPLEKAATALPSNAEAHALLGTAYQYGGQSDDALKAYEKAVQLAPNHLEYRSTYGLLLGLNKQHEAGIAELRKVTANAAYKDAAAWVNLGWLYRNVDPPRAKESVEAYRKSLQIDPKNAQAALGLGWAHLTSEQYPEAIAAFNKAMELDPKTTTGEAWNGIGWSHFFQKDLPKAKESVAKAKAAGRKVPQLEANIDRAEKGMTAAQAAAEARKAFEEEQRQRDEPDVGTLGNTLMRGGAAARRNAAAQLGRFGRPAVEFLLYAAVNDKDFGVRQAAITSLGNVGPAARQACPQLQSIARSNPYDQTVMSKEQMEAMVRYEDLRRAARGALAKIGC